VIQRARSVRIAVFALPLALLGIDAARAEESGACKPTHEIREDGRELRLRADGCALSLADTAAAIDALLDEAWNGQRMPFDRVSLGLGRIVDYPWLSKALAEAATKSPVWDPKKGHGRRTHDNAAVKSLVDTRRLLQPLASAFARRGAKARAGSVEKVLVGRVGETAELAPLVGHKLAEDKKLPFDAILWLRLERVATP
jgi:hypothetical protein